MSVAVPELQRIPRADVLAFREYVLPEGARAIDLLVSPDERLVTITRPDALHYARANLRPKHRSPCGGCGK